MERTTRFELAILGLGSQYSTAEPRPHDTTTHYRQASPIRQGYKWCLRTKSNRRHEDFQSSALPTELPRQKRSGLGLQQHIPHRSPKRPLPKAKPKGLKDLASYYSLFAFWANCDQRSRHTSQLFNSENIIFRGLW